MSGFVLFRTKLAAASVLHQRSLLEKLKLCRISTSREMCSKQSDFNLKQSESELHLKNIHEKHEREKEANREKWDSRRKLILLGMASATPFFVYYILERYGQPETDSITGVIFEDEYTGKTGENVLRAWKNIRSGVRTEFEEPSRTKLLPDPLQKPYIQPKYTVLIELKDLLVHPEWSFETGWRFRKRPGIEFLLETLVQHSYEAVIFTSEPALIAAPVIDSLNSKGAIMYSLFRDSTHYRSNIYTKDIARINRDHSKVVILETDINKVSPNPENALVIPPWDGNMGDRSLYDLAMFLRAIESTHCSDVRTFLKAYANEADPLETFRQRQIVLQQQAESRKSNTSKDKSFTRGFFQSKR